MSMNIHAKPGQRVRYTGATKEQAQWGGCDDPRFLTEGAVYTVEATDVHSCHTKVKLLHRLGWFNSVCFEDAELKQPEPVELLDGSANAHLIPDAKGPPCTQGYNHQSEGWLVSPYGNRVRPMCRRHADQRIIELAGVGGHWWFEPL